MKRLAVRILVFISAVISLPFFFNSCKGNLLGSGYRSAGDLQLACRLENGAVKKVTLDPSVPPEPFSGSKKVWLDGGGLTSLSTAANQGSAARVGLTVIADNACLAREDISQTVISRALVATGERVEGLQRQAYSWQPPDGLTENELERQASSEPCVVGISWNNRYKIQSMSFNDPNHGLQTYFDSVRAPDSYDLFYSPSGGLTTTGTAVQIAVVDTGVDWNHPDIRPSMWMHSLGAGIDITSINSGQINYDPSDVSGQGHGTHVSGMIAAAANNATGTTGLMPYRAQIMGIRLFKRDNTGELSTTSQFFYNAIQFAYLNGAQVINLSLGSVVSGPSSDAVAEAAVNEAVAKGVVVVVVIGNADTGNGGNIDGVNSSSIPGQYAVKAGVVGVGSYDLATGDKSYFSHYSTTFVELGAPGAEQGDTGVYSTIPTTLGSYGRLAGTSQAAPVVSAASGLVVAMIRERRKILPTPAEVERLLTTSAQKSAKLAPYFKDGNRIDFLGLAQRINQDYPAYGAGNPTVIPIDCL